MGLLDLKSDLSAAFNRKTKTASDMIGNPKASQLDYDATPKPYKIPNSGLGIGVRYDPSTSSYNVGSKLGIISDTSDKSGRHDKSIIDPKESKSTGRHEDSKVDIKALAPTPAKAAVEPIAMSATPVKQGVTPTILPKTANKAGKEVNKIPLSGKIENQSPEIKTTFIRDQVLLEDKMNESFYNIDDTPMKYSTHPFMSSYITTENNLSDSILDKIKPSNLNIDNDPIFYANDVIPSEFINDTFDELTEPESGDIFTIDKTIIGSNISTPYNVTFEDTRYTDTEAGQTYLNQNTQTDFFANLGTKRFNFAPTQTISSYPSATSSLPVGGYFGNFPASFKNLSAGVSLNRINYSSKYIDENDALFHIETGPPFAWSDKNNGFRSMGYQNASTHGVVLGTTNRNGFQNETIITFTDQITNGVNFFKGDTANNFFNNVLEGAWNVNGFTPLTNSTNIGQTGAHNPYISLSEYPIDMVNLTWDTGIQPRGMIGDGIYDTLFDASGTPKGKTDFFDDISLTNNFNIFLYDGISHTNMYGTNPGDIIEVGSLSNDGSKYFIPLLQSNTPWESINLTNYFDVTNKFQDGFKHYDNISLSGTPDSWTKWTAGSPMPSKYIGVLEGQYNNPGLYPTEISPGVFSTTNFFDSEEVYTKQFSIGAQGPGEAYGSSNFVGIVDDSYTAADIELLSKYAHNTLFSSQVIFYELGIDNLGDISFDGTNGDKYSSSGLPPGEFGNPDFSALVDEESGAFTHKLNDDFPYKSI